jgi:hypothetical protein
MTTSRAAGIPESAATNDSRAEDKIRGSFRQRLGGSRLARSVTASFAVGAVAVAVLAGAAPAYASDLNPDHTCWAVGGDGISTVAANPAGLGYWNVEEADQPGGGNLWSVDGAPIFKGDAYGGILRATPDGKGLYLVDVDGSIKSYGDAVQFGSIDAHSAYSPDGCGDVDDNRIAGIALTPSGQGMVALDEEGHVWAIGDAKYYGEEVLSGDTRYSAISMTPDGKGYTLLAKDGSVYTFGDAAFYGHTGVTGDATALVTTADGRGYWIMNSTGQTWAFGDAPSVGDLPVTSGVTNRYVDADRLADGTGIIATTEAGNVRQEDSTPMALDVDVTAVSGTPKTFALDGHSADGFPIESYVILSGPQHGTLGEPDHSGNVTYTPNQTQTGTTDSFTYEVLADGDASKPATVTITVQPNQGPCISSNCLSH